MNLLAVSEKLAVLAHTREKGIGLFAAQDICSGAVILRCPYIVVGPKSVPAAGTDLEHYIFKFPFTRSGKRYERSSLCAVVFGEASMLNHADSANCEWDWDIKHRSHKTIAARDIAKGEELTFCYGWEDEIWDNLGGKKA